MGWTGRFEYRLKDSTEYGPIELLIITSSRPHGVRWMPSSISYSEDAVGFSSIAPRLISGMESAGVGVWGSTSTGTTSGGTLESYRETAQSVNLRTWKPKASTFSFTVIDCEDQESEQLYDKVTRGHLVEVFAGYADFDFDEYQRINIGVITSIRRSRGLLEVTCDDAFSKLLGPSARVVTGTDLPKMFNGAGRAGITDEVISNNEQAIDYIKEDETLAFLADLKPGRDFFCIEVADNDEPTTKNVFLRCDASESSTSTIKRTASGSDAVFDWFFNRIGNPTAYTTPGVHVIDFETPFRVFYTPNPLDAANCDGLLDCLTRLLVSTGQRGAEDMNGPFDTLDKSLGFGLPNELFDRSEARNWHKSFEKRDLDRVLWTPFITSETDDGWSVIESGLSNLGIWITMKEGVYTLRTAISHSDDAEGTGGGVPIVRTEDIMEIRSHDFYSTECRVEHSSMKSTAIDHWAPAADESTFFQGDNPTGSFVIETRPFAGPVIRSTVDGPFVKTGPTTPNASTCWPYRNTEGDLYAAEFSTLQFQWYTRIPEVVEMELAGLRFCSLCPGDLIRVTTNELRGPEGYWDRRPAMVKSIRRDWRRGRVTLTIAALPTTNNRFG